MKLTYNSNRPDLIIPEYGRHIQNMVNHLLTIEEKEERNKTAKAIINVMGQLFPYLRDVEDFRHKLWDHLHVMSKFQLDVDSPYPTPKPEVLSERPKTVKYPQGTIRFGHYGKIVQDMIKVAVEMEDPEEKDQFTLHIANLMKRSYITWNRDNVKDEVIVADLKELSGGKLSVDPDRLQHINKIMSQLPPKTSDSSMGTFKRNKRKNSAKSNKKRRN